MRVCHSCKLEKPLESFKKEKKNSSGRGFECKLCVNKKAKEKLHKLYPNRKYYKTGNPRSNKDYIRERYKSDPIFKLSRLMRGRLNMALRINQKAGSAIRDLGCSIEELKSYLESKFEPGMSWDNHGKKGWHIDHIIPLSSFNLGNREELLRACHYTNLQPMWANANIAKRDKIIKDSI